MNNPNLRNCIEFLAAVAVVVLLAGLIMAEF